MDKNVALGVSARITRGPLTRILLLDSSTPSMGPAIDTCKTFINQLQGLFSSSKGQADSGGTSGAAAPRHVTWLLFSPAALWRLESGKWMWQDVTSITFLMLPPPLPIT